MQTGARLLVKIYIGGDTELLILRRDCSGSEDIYFFKFQISLNFCTGKLRAHTLCKIRLTENIFCEIFEAPFKRRKGIKLI